MERALPKPVLLEQQARAVQQTGVASVLPLLPAISVLQAMKIAEYSKPQGAHRASIVLVSYNLEWVCQPNNPSHPNCRGNKFVWPELVGKKGAEAKAVILKENPYISAVVYSPQDAIVTDEYCCNRVRLLMNCDAGCDYENATVFQVPMVG